MIGGKGTQRRCRDEEISTPACYAMPDFRRGVYCCMGAWPCVACGINFVEIVDPGDRYRPLKELVPTSSKWEQRIRRKIEGEDIIMSGHKRQ